MGSQKPGLGDPLQTEANYFEGNAERMRYPLFRSRGFFIGTGVMEAACKAIIGGRLKRSGMFWTVRGANSIIALRCCRLSGKRRTRRLMPLVDELLDALQAPGASVLDEVLRN